MAPGSRYLALGDSVTFGYEEPGVVPAPNYANAASFVNYPQELGAVLISSLVRRLNRTLNRAAKPFGRVVADGYAEFAAAAVHSANDPCAAGLLTQLGQPGTCGIHPTYAGHALLAQAVGKAIRPSALHLTG